MRNDEAHENTRPHRPEATCADDQPKLPAPSASYRRRAWMQFQRALDPLAPIKPLPPPRF